MTDHQIGLRHALYAAANFVMVIICTTMSVLTWNAGMVALCFFNAAMLVANLYLGYINFCRAKRLPMTKTYAIADLHGRFDLLFEAYERLAALEPGLIVHLGDYVDRGKDSAGVIRFLMNKATVPQGFNRLVLKGNHEQIMVETIRKPRNPSLWIANGGDATLKSYGHPKMRIRGSDCWPYNPAVVPDEHVDFLNALPRYFCDRHRVYVHAGLDENLTLPEQKDDMLFWFVHPKNHPGGYRGLHVVHGHEQHEKGPMLYESRSNLDVCAVDSNRLVIGVFDDDLPGGPIEIIEVKA